jgi:uncharacterized protein (DUF2235 family)
MQKNIVYCADGTWNHPGETEGGLVADTNVYKFYKALCQLATQEPHNDDGVTPLQLLVGRLFGGAAS